MTDRTALIIINIISGIGPVRVRELCSLFGSPAKILSLSAEKLAAAPNIGKKLAHDISSWEKKINYQKELDMADKAGVQIITHIDDEYPPLLKEIYDPPLCLYVRGELPVNTDKNIGIVGSRRVTNYGSRIGKHLAESASFANWTVVSGLAYGIDAVAHQAVVEANGKTIAVLGGGLARVHPQDHVPLAKKIIETGGAVISEFPMEFSPNKWSFPMRNRIISGLSQGVVVVEAGLRSGSLITAKCALDQGRTVFAVPGQADNPQAKGTNQLIKTGAKLTESFDDVLEEFEFLPGLKAEEHKIQQEEMKLELPEEEQAILDALSKGPLSADQLANETAIPPGALLSQLMKLEMKKLISQLPGKIFEARS